MINIKSIRNCEQRHHYPSRELAAEYANRSTRDFGWRLIPYKCPVCGGWCNTRKIFRYANLVPRGTERRTA